MTTDQARARLRAWARGRVIEALRPRRTGFAEARGELGALRDRLRTAEQRVDTLALRADRTPLSLATTIHAAHHRHPGVQAAFARRGLPACLDCPVGADESLGEAAFAEGFDADELLAELQALLGR